MASKDSNKGKKGVIETDYRTPGLKGAQTTTLFRAVNPELFIKPVRDASHPVLYFNFIFRDTEPPGAKNKPMMAFGLITITLCVGYLGYLHAMKANDQQLYEAIDGEGERLMRRKASKWA